MIFAPLVYLESIFIANSPTWMFFLIVGHYSDPRAESLECIMNIVFSNNVFLVHQHVSCHQFVKTK